ncbi:RNA polymerase sigma factor SigM [Mycolicibacterium baixiangningiae]|uniref:RNA polymerase sigma factor SigM n=1 Tax=Mycolicibacterium baixiangningiae TaxID=2761578 RepID=UPI0018D098FC|nr:RNA polymerase sigma factor SigM [Mycolicibacterium baixiangningiae]
MGSFDAVGRSDAQLLADHVAGDRFAFEELFLRHHHHLERLALITSRNHDDAADALQDAMLSAHRKAAAFRYDSAVSSWLYRIVVNACLDRLRRNRNHVTSALHDDVGPVGDPTARVDTAIVVERALQRLPVEQRAAIVAVDMQGYSVAETARMLGIAEGTVKSRCSRGRAKLAEALRDLDEPNQQPPVKRGCRPSPRSAHSATARHPTIARAVRHAGPAPADRP